MAHTFTYAFSQFKNVAFNYFLKLWLEQYYQKQRLRAIIVEFATWQPVQYHEDLLGVQSAPSTPSTGRAAYKAPP